MESKLQQRRRKVKEERASSVNSNRLETRRREYRELKGRASTPEKIIIKQNLTINVDDMFKTPEIASIKVKPEKKVTLSYIRPNGRKDDEEYIIVNEAIPESPGVVPMFTKQPLINNQEKNNERSHSKKSKKVWTLGKIKSSEPDTDSFSEDRASPQFTQRMIKQPLKKSPSPGTAEREWSIKNQPTYMLITENSSTSKEQQPYKPVEKIALKTEEVTKSPSTGITSKESSSKKQSTTKEVAKDSPTLSESTEHLKIKNTLSSIASESIRSVDKKLAPKPLVPLVSSVQLTSPILEISKSKSERKNIQLNTGNDDNNVILQPDPSLRVIVSSPKNNDALKLKKEHILPRAPATKDVIEIPKSSMIEVKSRNRETKKHKTARESGSGSRSRITETNKATKKLLDLKTSIKIEARSEGRPDSRLDRKTDKKPPSRKTSPRNITGKSSATEADTILSSLSLIILQKKTPKVQN